jgi:hypothetical protein
VGLKARADVPSGSQFDAACQKGKRRIRFAPPLYGVLWTFSRAFDEFTIIGGPSYALAQGSLAYLFEIAAVGDVHHQPSKSLIPDWHSLRESEERSYVVLALKIEVRYSVNAPAETAIHRNLKSLFSKLVSSRHVLSYEGPTSPLILWREQRMEINLPCEAID